MVAIIVIVCSMIQYFTQIWHILNGLDFEGGRKIDIDQKFFFLDMDWLGPKGMTENITACEQALGNSTAAFIIFRQKLKDTTRSVITLHTRSSEADQNTSAALPSPP